jgi:hypothetical protein
MLELSDDFAQPAPIIHDRGIGKPRLQRVQYRCALLTKLECDQALIGSDGDKVSEGLIPIHSGFALASSSSFEARVVLMVAIQHYFASWKMMPTVWRIPDRTRLTPCRRLTR